MLLLISPAKKLDFEEPAPDLEQTVPEMLDQAAMLAEIMRGKTAADLKKLMKLSDNLARLNVERYQHWTTETDPQHAKQAILAFQGEVYAGMAATTFERGDFDFAQNHLRILSGLYGLLRPLDMIQPHRLEMGTKLENPRGGDLYAYWKNETAPRLQREIERTGGVLVNLASQEYFKSVDLAQLGNTAEIYTPIFKDEKNGVMKIISIYAKRARGMMCDFVIRNRLENPQAMKDFAMAGYRFFAEESTEHEFVFVRREQDKP